jgi:hypothetical protein
MPQATLEQRKRWGGALGVGEDKAEAFLEERGWVLTRQWQWVPPTLGYYASDEEHEAIAFLIDEWDYGGIVRGPRRFDPRYQNCCRPKDTSKW